MEERTAVGKVVTKRKASLAPLTFGVVFVGSLVALPAHHADGASILRVGAPDCSIDNDDTPNPTEVILSGTLWVNNGDADADNAKIQCSSFLGTALGHSGDAGMEANDVESFGAFVDDGNSTESVTIVFGSVSGTGIFTTCGTCNTGVGYVGNIQCAYNLDENVCMNYTDRTAAFSVFLPDETAADGTSKYYMSEIEDNLAG